MVAKRFEAIFARFQASKRLVAVAVGALLLGAVGGLFSIPLEHSLDVMLPVNSEARQTISFLNEIDFSTKVLISMARASGALDQQAFMAEVDAFSESIDSPLVTQTLSRFDQSGAMHDIAFFLARVPDLFDEAAQTQLEEQLTPDEVGAALRRKYVQLLKPEGSFMGAMIRRDPLDMQMAIAERLRGLSTAFGYDMHIEDGHIMSADGDHALIVLETTVPFTDAAGSRELIQMLDGYMDSVPDAIAFDVVCGHLHTLGNEKVIRRDIGWTVGIAGTAFVLLFLFFFKDARANLVFLLPFASLPIAVNMTALVFGSLSPMMLGFGSVIAGITVDYAIHVYIAVRRGSDALEAVRSVARPVLLGAVTTGAVFAAFLSSSIPGYHQLACFALCSVVIAVVESSDPRCELTNTQQGPPYLDSAADPYHEGRLVGGEGAECWMEQLTIVGVSDPDRLHVYRDSSGHRSRNDRSDRGRVLVSKVVGPFNRADQIQADLVVALSEELLLSEHLDCAVARAISTNLRCRGQAEPVLEPDEG